MIYTFIIVGAGAGGCMAALELSKLFPDESILLLEKNKYTFDEYVSKGYDQLSSYLQAMTNPQFSQTMLSTEQKTVWWGQGLGGGTLHFGLQFINTKELIEKSYPTWQEDFNAVTSLLQPQSYTEPPSLSWAHIQSTLSSNANASSFRTYSNPIYAKNIATNERLLLGQKIKERTQITIQYDTVIDQLVWNDTFTKALGVMDNQQKTYGGQTILIAAGSLQTAAILQRSGIGSLSLLDSLQIPVRHILPVGEQLMDHAGITFTYQNIPPMSVTWNEMIMEKIYSKLGRYVYQVQGENIPTEDKGTIYDFTSWIQNHPGGKTAIEQWVKKQFTLVFPHDTSRWFMYKQQFEPALGKINDTVNVSEIPPLYQSIFQPLSLDSDTIVGYLQTRNPPHFTWQTYWNGIPKTKSSPLLVTYALSTKIPSDGKVYITSRDPLILPTVTLNELTSEGISYLLESIQRTEAVLDQLGFTNKTTDMISSSYIENNYDSIYHYHGTCPIGKVVTETFQILGVDNVFLSDLSVLPKPWGGSTSVPSLVVGYRVAQSIRQSRSS